MRDNGKIVEQGPIGAGDIVITAEFETVSSGTLTRVFFATSEGISRHTDMDNLKKCLEGELRFDVDAFFFRHERAIHEANILLASDGISDSTKKYLEQKITVWEGEKEMTETVPDEISLEETIYDKMKWVKRKPFVREEAKVGRNDPCTCGSGKKYKKCCGAKNG